MGHHKMKPAKIETGPDIQEAWVHAPLKTWAQFVHELDSGSPTAGRERVMRNRTELMGGACRFKCTPAQEEAASRFRAIYEQSQVGGAKAVDPSREAVDGGGINPESVILIGADARAKYNHLFTALGRQVMQRLEFVIMSEKGPTPYAQWRYRNRKPNARIVADGMVEMRGYLDEVAVLLRLQNRRAA